MKFYMDVVRNIFLSWIIVRQSFSIEWLGLAKISRSHNMELDSFTREECEQAKQMGALQKRHYRFCTHQKHKYAMHAIVMASKAAVYYCMKTFGDRRWNCTSIEKLPTLTADLKMGTQEQAVVHAFSSAALLFEISRRCSQSKLKHCPCGKNSENKLVSDSQSSKYFFTNCPDNVDVGIDYSQKFLGFHKVSKEKNKIPNTKYLTAEEKAKRKRQRILRINSHNYRAGVEIMKSSWKSRCKCHGVSGSCSHEICFRQLRRLDDEVILNKLKDQYLSAQHVRVGEDQKLYLINDSSESSEPKVLKDIELAYIEHSPDYCESDPKVGSVGTVGRECETLNITASATNHCNNMCCGRGYREVVETEPIRCHCRLDQSFIVICKLCSKIKIKKFCL